MYLTSRVPGTVFYTTTARLLVLTVALVVLWMLVDVPQVIGGLLEIPIPLLVLATAIAVLRLWLMSLRWRMVHPRGSSMPLSRFFGTVMAGWTCSLFLPGSVGGDVVRMALFSLDKAHNRFSGALSVIVDRGVGVSSVLALSAVGCLFMADVPGRMVYLGMSLSGVALVMVGYLLLTRLPFRRRETGKGRVRIFVEGLRSELASFGAFYRASPGALPAAFAVSVVNQVLWFVVVLLLARAIGLDVGFLTLSVVTAVSWVVSAAPVSVSGLGVRELSYVYLLSFQGVEPEQATVLSLYQFSITVLVGLIGLPFLWTTTRGAGRGTGGKTDAGG